MVRGINQLAPTPNKICAWHIIAEKEPANTPSPKPLSTSPQKKKERSTNVKSEESKYQTQLPRVPRNIYKTRSLAEIKLAFRELRV